MLKTITIIALLLSMSPFYVSANPAPQFELTSRSGAVSLAALKGKVIYLDFWASWCGPCRKSFPWMNEIQAKYEKDGFVVLAINLDRKRQQADEFLAETPANFTIAFDPSGKTADDYRVMGMPTSYIIDRTGEIKASHIGFLTKDQTKLEEHIKTALGKQ